MKVPPSGRVPEQGPDWFLVATEAYGGGTPDLGFFSGVLGYVGLYRQKKSIGGVLEGPTRHALLSPGLLEALLT